MLFWEIKLYWVYEFPNIAFVFGGTVMALMLSHLVIVSDVDRMKEGYVMSNNNGNSFIGRVLWLIMIAAIGIILSYCNRVQPKPDIPIIETEDVFKPIDS